jgi:hypothetical protein
VVVEGDGAAKGDVKGDGVELIHDDGSSNGIDIARPPPLISWICGALCLPGRWASSMGGPNRGYKPQRPARDLRPEICPAPP